MTAKSLPTYPFVPRSTAALVPGQFWAIPLSDGTFGCGRVIELGFRGSVGSRVVFLAAVLDWHAGVPPTSEAIAAAACLDQGKVHIKAITESGGCILGHRALGLDNIEPWEFREATFHVNSRVFKGLEPLRPQQPSDTSLPVLTSWGFRVPVVIAEARFIKGIWRPWHAK